MFARWGGGAKHLFCSLVSSLAAAWLLVVAEGGMLQVCSSCLSFVGYWFVCVRGEGLAGNQLFWSRGGDGHEHVAKTLGFQFYNKSKKETRQQLLLLLCGLPCGCIYTANIRSFHVKGGAKNKEARQQLLLLLCGLPRGCIYRVLCRKINGQDPPPTHTKTRCFRF